MAHTSHGAHQHLSHLPVEPIAAIVLAAAGVTTSWAGYQASLWDGIQLTHFGKASSQRVLATQASLDASLTRAVEINIFQGWAEARFNNDERMAAYYEGRFPPELREEFRKWMALRAQDEAAAPPSPFAMPSYRPKVLADAAKAEAAAEKEFQAAIQSKHTADAYLQAGVVLATAMFFAGIGQVFKRPLDRLVLAGIAVVALLAGVVMVATLPILSLNQAH